MRQFLPLILVAACLLFSCQKEEINNLDKGFPIELNIESVGQSSILSWTATNISTFEEYLVVRSFDSIPTGINPEANFVIAQIDDYEEASFRDASLSFEEELFYKVYVDIGDRFLESPSIKASRKILRFDFFASDITYDASQDVFFLKELSAGEIHRFDVAQNEITHSVAVDNFEDFIVGTYAGQRELYVSSQGNGLIQIYDATNLELIADFSTGKRTPQVETNNRGLLFCAIDDFDEQLTVYRRSDFTRMGSANNTAGSSGRTLTLLNEATNELLESTFDGLFYYRFDDDGNLMESKSNTFQTGFVLNNIRISPDKTRFIPFQSGEVFNTNLELQTGGLFSNDISDFVFSPDGSQLACGFNFFGFIQVFSFPSFQATDGFDLFLDDVQYMVPYGDDGAYYAVGRQTLFSQNFSFIRTLQFQ